MEFTDISSPILDLLSPTIRDESIDSVEWSEYEPQEPNARKLLQIWVNNTDQYTLPCEAYLEIAGQLTKADGTLYAEGDKIAIVNNGIMALFGDARYKVNGMTVESVDNNVGIATTVMGLARMSDDYAKTAGTNFMWAKDTSEAAETDPAAADYNLGFAIRQKLLHSDDGDGKFTAIVPLSHIFGFARDVRKVFYGVKHELELQRRQTDDEAIHRYAAVDAGKITLTKLSLWMPAVVPSLAWRTTLEGWMSQRQSLVTYFQSHQIEQRADTVADISWKLASKSGLEKPRHVFVCFQAAARRDDQAMSPHVFDALDLQQIHIAINSKRFPTSDLNLDFNGRRYGRAYKMLLDFAGRDQNVDTGMQVTLSDFRTLYPIYHFNLEKQEDRLKDSTLDITVKAKFGGAPGNYRAYALILSDRLLTITADGGKMNVVF